MQKKQKIKPENKKLKNYLKVPFRSPSRSLFKLNSRTASTLLFRCFLCFLFKGGGRSGEWGRFVWNFRFALGLKGDESLVRFKIISWCFFFPPFRVGKGKKRGFSAFKDVLFLLPWCKRNKRSSLKIQSLKTTSKCRSAARAVRFLSSTRGLLTLYFFVFFLCFLFKGGGRSGERGRFVWNFRFAPALKGDESLVRFKIISWCFFFPPFRVGKGKKRGFSAFKDVLFILPWCKRNKRSSLKIKNLKTTSKCRSSARVVRFLSSTRGLLPLYFFVVFLFKGVGRSGVKSVYGVIIIIIIIIIIS
jgi:hypothetical protein